MSNDNKSLIDFAKDGEPSVSAGSFSIFIDVTDSEMTVTFTGEPTGQEAVTAMLDAIKVVISSDVDDDFETEGEA